jgi:hypothetical protein
MTANNDGRIDGHPPLYVLSTLFFLLALLGIAALLLFDIMHHLSFSSAHQHIAAFPLSMIGLSYVTLNLATRQSRTTQVKGVFLGIAFLLWGGEQLLPSSWITTVMDEGAVAIFVVDVSLIIWGRLSQSDDTLLP